MGIFNYESEDSLNREAKNISFDVPDDMNIHAIADLTPLADGVAGGGFNFYYFGAEIPQDCSCKGSC